MKENDEFTTNSGLICKVIKIISSKKVLVKFEITGTVKEVYTDNLSSGKVRDDYYPSVYGIGYLGFRNKKLPYYKQASQLWNNMMKRCYSEKDNKGYFGNVIVDKRWHCFSNFLEDLPNLENFDKWLIGGKSTSDKYQLDKDLKGDGTIYSLFTCKFITEFENKSLGAKNARAWDSRYGRSKPIK